MVKYTNYDYIYNMAYVYRHIRLDKNEVFYVGISCNKRNDYVRSNEKTRRGDWWKKIIAKTDYKVDIIFDDVTPEFAKEKEIEFIKLYGRKDLGLGTLVNMTDGGDGLNNRVFTPEYRLKLSIAAKKRIVTDEQKEKLRGYRLGKKLTEKHKKAISDWNKNKKLSESHILSIKKRMTENNPSSNKFGAESKSFKGYIIATKDGVFFGKYEGIGDAARKLNTNSSKICAVANGRRKTHLGFVFYREK